MSVKAMAEPPLKVMNRLIEDSRRLLNEGRPRVARGTLYLADFYLQVARHGDPPCGSEYADGMERDILRLKEEADRLAAELPQEATSETV